jgi:hypothetical protein
LRAIPHEALAVAELTAIDDSAIAAMEDEDLGTTIQSAMHEIGGA